MTMIRIIQGDVLKGLAQIPDESVHCVVTSPPYWGLRDYSACSCATRRYRGLAQGEDTGGAMSHEMRRPDPDCPRCHGTGYDKALRDQQIGLETTPEEYVEKMVAIFREVRRVLRKDGTVWLNMGDCYAGGGRGPSGVTGFQQAEKRQGFIGGDPHGAYHNSSPPGYKPKDLIGVPWRLAFALQADGWWLRKDIIWYKPNCMPESTRDRPTSAHEYLFLLTKRANYFYDQDAIREKPTSSEMAAWDGYGGQSWHDHGNDAVAGQMQKKPHMAKVSHPMGRNKRSVWTIHPQPFPEAHFATFPEKLVEPCIKAGTSERGCCPKCGAPWERVVEKGESDEEWKAACGANSEGEYRGVSHKQQAALAHPPGTIPNDLHKQDALGKPTYTGFNARYKAKMQVQNASDVKRRILAGMRERISSWSPTCTCDAGETVPCVVLDPFGGSGTVAKVARDLGRSSIMIELSPAYVEMMKKRLRYFEQLSSGVIVEMTP